MMTNDTLMKTLLWITLANGFYCNTALADWQDRLQFHGFFTQGYVNTSANNWFGDSTDGSLDFTEIGINASLQVHPRMRLSAQGLSRRAGEMDDGSPKLDFALLDFTVLQQPDVELGMRLGRIKNEIGLYNSTRDVAATRPGVFMPQSVYFDRVRDLLLSIDGGSYYAAWHSDFGSFYLDGNVGYLNTDENVESTFWGNDLPGETANDGLNTVTRLLYEYQEGVLRLALTHVDFTVAYQPGQNDPFIPGRVGGTYWLGSAEYNSENWSLTLEYGQEPIKYQGVQPLLFERVGGTLETYYLQYTRRLSSKWSGWLRFEQTFVDKNERDGKQRARITGLPPHASFATAWVAGLRWDITPAWMLSAEYQYNDGTFYLSVLDNPPSLANEERHWDIFSVLVSYRF